MKKSSCCKVPAAFALLLAIGFVNQAAAEALRQHQAHVHGEAVGHLSLDGEELRLDLTIPGVNLVGFEHPPRDEAQRERLAASLAALEQGGWLSLDARGRCESVALDAHAHGFDEDEANPHGQHGHGSPEHDHRHDHRHDHGHEHGHEHHHSHGEQKHEHAQHDHQHGHDGHDQHHGHDHEHAEFHLRGLWHCARPDALRWVEVNLFEQYPGNERIVLDVLTEQTARRARLEPGRIRASLEP